MSEIIVNIPDDGWIRSESDIKPTGKTLCIILHRYGDQTPGIYQFRKADFLYSEADYFLDVSEKWMLDSLGCSDEWNPSFATFEIVDYWKPLGLPAEKNQRLLKQIESWFED